MNRNYRALYIWWIAVLLLATGTFWVGYEGYILDIWVKDVTYLTSVITLIMIYGVALMGIVSWKIYTDKDPKTVTKYIDRVWFLSEIEMALAIVGTGIGIILLLGINSDINVSDPTALQSLLTHLWATLGVAFYPNAIGLISSLLLKTLAYFISEDLTEHEK